MSTPTISDMIANAISGAEEIEEQTSESATAKQEPKAEAASVVESEVEKLASVMEFIGRRGVENFLQKEATSASAPPPGTDADKNVAAKATHSQVGPNKHSPPMSGGKKVGKVEDNSASQPGGKGSVDTSSSQHGDHHPALASNEAVIAAKKTIHSKEVSPALKQALTATPFADKKAKENVQHAAAGGDKNIHKQASAQTLDGVRAELARRVEAAKAQQGSAS